MREIFNLNRFLEVKYMGRGNEIITTNRWMYICDKSGTTKNFQCKKELNSYIKRHCKRCGCSFIPAEVNNYYGRKQEEFITIN